MSLIKQAGFTGAAANTMYGIVMAESGGNAVAHNTNAGTGDNSYGLAQINMLGNLGPARLAQYGLSSADQLFDPLTNLKVAYKMSGGGTHFGDWSTYNSGAYLKQAPGGTITNAGSAGGGVATANADGSVAPVALTPAQKKLALENGIGVFASLINSTPELKNLLTNAIQKGLSPEEFKNQVDNSVWYRTHSEAVKTNLALQASDPKEYADKLNAAGAHVKAFFQQYGIAPPAAQMDYITKGYFLNGRNDDQLLQYVQAHEGTMHFSGGAVASAYSQVQKIAAEYGIPLSRASQNDWSEKIGLGQANVDTFTQTAQKTAMSMYPGMADQIKAGLTMKDIADPYVQTMSNLLETNPNTIDWTKDPTIKKALQGTGATAAGGTPTATPLWQFEQQVRADPKWQLTKNAHQATSQLLTSLGTDWGFQ
jgi:hypothetical protein